MTLLHNRTDLCEKTHCLASYVLSWKMFFLIFAQMERRSQMCFRKCLILRLCVHVYMSSYSHMRVQSYNHTSESTQGSICVYQIVCVYCRGALEAYSPPYRLYAGTGIRQSLGILTGIKITSSNQKRGGKRSGKSAKLCKCEVCRIRETGYVIIPFP